MYESYYGFREKPFSLLPDPEFIYLGGRYRTAWGLLEYGLLNQAGFVVITGETGTGKTTLLRKLLAEAEAECTVGNLAYTHGSWNSLMPWILMAFGLPWKEKDPVEQFQSFSEFLMEQMVKGRRVVLIVDEAQNLLPGMLEELRLLSNLNSEKSPMLQIVLSGQPALRALLQGPDLKQFAQRVAVDYTLEAMDEKDATEYIRHRLRVAGGDPALFSPQACAAVHRLTGGLPRLINQVCDMALAYGYAEQTQVITARLVADAARDRTAGCILPLATNVDLTDLREESVTPKGPVMDTHKRVKPSLPEDTAVDVSKSLITEPNPEPRLSQAPRNETVVRGQQKAPAVSQTDQPPDDLPRKASDVTCEEWFQRGQLLRKRGRHKDALRALAEAARDPSLSFRAYTEAGFCYREAGRINEATEAFRKAFSDRTAARDDRVAVCYELGRTLETARKPAEALDCYQRVSRVDATFQDVSRRIERLSRELQIEDAPTARTNMAQPEHSNGSSTFWGRLQRLFGTSPKARASDPKRR